MHVKNFNLESVIGLDRHEVNNASHRLRAVKCSSAVHNDVETLNGYLREHLVNVVIDNALTIYQIKCSTGAETTDIYRCCSGTGTRCDVRRNRRALVKAQVVDDIPHVGRALGLDVFE